MFKFHRNFIKIYVQLVYTKSVQKKETKSVQSIQKIATKFVQNSQKLHKKKYVQPVHTKFVQSA